MSTPPSASNTLYESVSTSPSSHFNMMYDEVGDKAGMADDEIIEAMERIEVSYVLKASTVCTVLS